MTLPVAVPLAESPSPVWRRIATDLATAISEGRYRPGDVLPTALQLAETYAVHRHTARQALLHLQQQGLVSVERGRGTFVTQPHLPYRIGRRVSFTANAGAAGVVREGAILKIETIAAEDAVAAALNLAPHEEVWRIETFSRASGVAISTGTHFISRQLYPAFDRHLQAGSASMSRAFALSGVADYLRLSTALSARPATPEEATILDLPVGAPVIVSRALDGLPDGAPLHFMVSVFAGERVEFLIEPQER